MENYIRYNDLRKEADEAILLFDILYPCEPRFAEGLIRGVEHLTEIVSPCGYTRPPKASETLLPPDPPPVSESTTTENPDTTLL